MGLLRTILAISVIIAHSSTVFGFTLTGGLVAVQVFFIISGFYMALILDKKYTGEGHYKLFISNRFLRLYPVYWVVLCLTILACVVQFLLFKDYYRLSAYAAHFDVMSLEAWLVQIFSNLAIFGQDIVMFLGMNPENGTLFFTPNFQDTKPAFHSFLLIPQAWSLSMEIMFYLIAPFILRRNILLIVLFALSLGIGFYTDHLGLGKDPWTYRFFPSALALFILGSFSYKFYQRLKNSRVFNLASQLTITTAFFTILIFYQYIFFRVYMIGDQAYIPSEWIFYSLTFIALPFIFALSKSLKYDTRIGELSYPIYISHLLVIGMIAPLINHFSLGAYQGELAVLCTIIVSYILVRIISDPIEKIRQARVKGTA